MAEAKLKNTVLAQSDNYEFLEGNVYFPPSSVHNEYLIPSNTVYECPWKGHADYFHIKVNNRLVEDAAWHYPNPFPAAKQIKGHVAFDQSKGIIITK